MRYPILTSFSIVLFLVCIVSTAWGLPELSLRKRILQRPQENPEIRSWLRIQQPIMGGAHPKVVMPPSAGTVEGATDPQGDSNSHDNPIISDVLPKTRGINIFASLTRDFESIESRLNDASKNLTVLAPRNSAIQDLPRKPWENPDDYEQYGEASAYEGQDGHDRARRNLKRFVEAHILPSSPWDEGEKVETLGGEKVWWTKDGDTIFIQPGNIEVDTVAEQVANGEVWVINGVINYR